jgi:hypothetical protein
MSKSQSEYGQARSQGGCEQMDLYTVQMHNCQLLVKVERVSDIICASILQGRSFPITEGRRAPCAADVPREIFNCSPPYSFI